MCQGIDPSISGFTSQIFWLLSLSYLGMSAGNPQNKVNTLIPDLWSTYQENSHSFQQKNVEFCTFCGASSSPSSSQSSDIKIPSEASVTEGKECDTAGTLEDNSEEEQGSNGSADHAASEEHSSKEQTLESQMSDPLSDLDIENTEEVIERISEDDNLCDTAETVNDNNIVTDTTEILDFIDDHQNSLQVKNESHDNTENLVDIKNQPEEHEIEDTGDEIIEKTEKEEKETKSEDDGICENKYSKETRGESKEHASDEYNEDKAEEEEDSWEYEWEDEDENEYEFYEVDEDEYKVQTFDGSFSIAI